MTIEPLVDHRGTKIEVDSQVCFNYSGEIALGVVEDAKPAEKDGWRIVKRASIKVRQSYPNKGKVSVVKSPKNVMVVFE